MESKHLKSDLLNISEGSKRYTEWARDASNNLVIRSLYIPDENSSNMGVLLAED